MKSISAVHYCEKERYKVLTLVSNLVARVHLEVFQAGHRTQTRQAAVRNTGTITHAQLAQPSQFCQGQPPAASVLGQKFATYLTHRNETCRSQIGLCSALHASKVTLFTPELPAAIQIQFPQARGSSQRLNSSIINFWQPAYI